MGRNEEMKELIVARLNAKKGNNDTCKEGEATMSNNVLKSFLKLDLRCYVVFATTCTCTK